MFVHKKSKKKLDVSKPIILEIPPYGQISKDKFPLFSKDLLPKDFNPPEDTKFCMFLINCRQLPDAMILYPKTLKWNQFHSIVLDKIRRMDYDNPEEIEDVGLSNESIFKLNTSKIIDSTIGTPYECLPDRAIVNVSMFKRPNGWKPIVVGYCLCAFCGKIETENLKLKRCSKCKSVNYCSKECQLNDWKNHKTDCS